MKLFLISILIFTSVITINKPQNDPLKDSINRGEEIYTDFCMSCHLPNGEGVKKMFPPLAKSDYLIKNQEASIRAIKFGITGPITVNDINYNNTMMPLGLSDKEIADVMNYINNSWGNENKKIITAEAVSKVNK